MIYGLTESKNLIRVQIFEQICLQNKKVDASI